MMREATVEATVSVNGGPRVPVGVVVDQVVRGVAATLRGAEKHLKGARERQLAQEAVRVEAADVPAWGNISADRLRSLVERIERLEEERKTLGSDIKDIFQEAKSAGFDVKALRQIIKMRTWEPAHLEEHEALIDTYRRALGM